MTAHRSLGESLHADIRGVRYHVRRWGPVDAPKLFLLHGWWDASASFEFLARALPQWQIIAPDWRGCGESGWSESGAYWFNDYLGDLHLLLERFGDGAPARVVAHSMSFNVASVYAGCMPQRISSLVNLDCYGFRHAEVRGRLSQWLSTLGVPRKERHYASADDFADRLVARRPYLPLERARFFAHHLVRPLPEGGVVLRGDPALADPARLFVYNGSIDIAEVMECWRHVEAPVLWVNAERSTTQQEIGASEADMHARRACFSRLSRAQVDSAGHMLHQERPEVVAALIDAFLKDVPERERDIPTSKETE